jgi:predicted DNA-binding transcriptional regulator AlpA
MRYISVKDNRTKEEHIYCMSHAAEFLGVAVSTVYNWENKHKEEVYRHWTITFPVTLHLGKKKSSTRKHSKAR